MLSFPQLITTAARSQLSQPTPPTCYFQTKQCCVAFCCMRRERGLAALQDDNLFPKYAIVAWNV
ncbi:hypothetical protein HYPSUDRAFT_80262 [Hypholoma sublateritium FD-334 SS-4]|uniref:Uncharacterized protein n=1 Tax=Hypholoma sublateritium (strain FD-334 SS-4) TaxID=945553 RepID=A0A0D2LYM2_HYPSF|nr:hypothetical protein HYPSUDRAFT_80262 [Hypholoma sublateritium FD-334 SS-4]